MGSNRYTQLTPFLVVKGTKLVKIPKVNRICKEHPKLKQPNNKFCSECGGVIINVDYIEKSHSTPAQVIFEVEEFEDRFATVEYLDGVLIINEKSPYHNRDLYVDTNDNAYIDLATPEIMGLMLKEIEWVKIEYVKEIEFLEKEFGKDNVTVSWGLITYWS